jgi:hypothetical protein
MMNAAAATALRASHLVEDEFLPAPTAEAMRAAIERHFGDPYKYAAESRMAWNYFYVPDLYVYMRTSPEKILGAELAKAFQDRLTRWSRANFGLVPRGGHYLSLYVHGCRQTEHNDTANGRFGFVYSLTKNERRTTGGETVIWREDALAPRSMRQPKAGEDVYHAIAPRFNRLVLFDDRLPHAVRMVEGNMDPVEGRIVLHGHLIEAGPSVDGPLPLGLAVDIVRSMAVQFFAEPNIKAAYHGVAVIRLMISLEGKVVDCRVLVDRIKQLVGGEPTVRSMVTELLARAASLRFPAATDVSAVTIPFRFGDQPGYSLF